MELDEVLQRVLRRYGVYLAAAVLIPVAVAWMIVSRQPPTYESTARIQLTATTPETATAADAMVSQARAAVTSSSAVEQALSSAGVRRGVENLTRNHITVTGLGTSSTIDVAVTDHNRDAAARIASALATELVSSTNKLRLGNLPDILSSIDSQLTQLAINRASLATAAQRQPKDAVAQNRLAGIDRLISDLSGDRNRLALEAAAGGHATILDRPGTPTRPLPSRVPQVVVLVALCALVVGLLVVAIIETLRPHVSGAARIARLLRTQPLGAIVMSKQALSLEPGLGQRLRLAAQRAACSLVVIVPVGKLRHVDLLVSTLGAEMIPVAEPIYAEAPVGGVTNTAVEANAKAESEAFAEASVGASNAGQGGDAPAAAPWGLWPLSHPPERSDTADGAGVPAQSNGRSGGGETSASAPVRWVRRLDELGAVDENERVAILVAATPVAPRADTDKVQALLQISGWPLLGVVTVSQTRRFWER